MAGLQSATKVLTDHVITEVDLVRSNLLEMNSIFDATASGFGDIDSVKELVDCLDTDKDDRVSYREFIRGFGENLPYDFVEFVTQVTEYEAIGRQVRKMVPSATQAESTVSGAEPAVAEADTSENAAVRQALLQDVFSAFDLDGDGFVDSEELLQLGAARQKLRQRGMVWTEEKNRLLVESLDKNSDGMVSQQEFVQGFNQKCPPDLVEFARLMMEYEAVARWVREQLKRGAQVVHR